MSRGRLEDAQGRGRGQVEEQKTKGAVTGMALREFWRNWVYDSSKTPIKWEPHPHRAFKIIARLAGVSLGTMAPLSLVLLQSGIPKQLDNDMFKFSWEVLVAVLGIAAVWLASFFAAVASAQKTLMRYVYLGSVAPSNIAVFCLWIQGVR